MYSQKEIDDIKTIRQRMRDESMNGEGLLESHDEVIDKHLITGKHNDSDLEALVSTESSFHLDGNRDKSIDEEFVDNFAEMSEKEGKSEDACVNSVKTSEIDVTRVVYDSKPKEKEEKSDKMDLLNGLPKVELIRLLISKLEDGQSPSDYIKTYDSRDKAEDEEDSPYEVSDLAHVLTMSWQNVYFMTKDEIVEALLNYKNNDKELKTYEFRWVRDELAVHGPYQHEDILMWIVYGYVSEENPILVRELNEDGNPITLDWQNYKDSDIFNIFAPSPENSNKRKSDSSSKKDDEKDANQFDFMNLQGFMTRKRSKMMGLKVKDKPRIYGGLEDHYG